MYSDMAEKNDKSSSHGPHHKIHKAVGHFAFDWRNPLVSFVDQTLRIPYAETIYIRSTHEFLCLWLRIYIYMHTCNYILQYIFVLFIFLHGNT